MSRGGAPPRIYRMQGGSRTFTTPPVEGASGVVAVRPTSNDRHSSATRTTSTAERRGGAASLLEHRIFWIGRSVDSVLAGCRAQTPCSEGAHSNIHIPAQAQQPRTTTTHTHHDHTTPTTPRPRPRSHSAQDCRKPTHRRPGIQSRQSWPWGHALQLNLHPSCCLPTGLSTSSCVPTRPSNCGIGGGGGIHADE